MNPLTTPVVPEAGPIRQLGLPDTTTLEARRKYDNVDSNAKPESAAALARLNQCNNTDPSKNITGISDKAFAELKSQLEGITQPGDHVDHLVPQAQTDKFGTQVIQHPGNVVAEPDYIHTAKTGIGNRAVREGSVAAELGYGLNREYHGSMSYEDQLRIGIREQRQAMDERNASPEDRARVEKQLQAIERRMPEVCGPKIDVEKLIPTMLDNRQNAIEGHNQTSARPLPDARSVAEWDGSTRSGTFVDFGNGLVAQHQGRGAYAVADVQQQLGGVQPPIGQYATLQQNGQIQAPQQTQSLGMQRG